MRKAIPPEEQVIYRLSAGVVMESFADGALLLRLSDQNFFELNPTSRDILRLCDGRSLGQLASGLAREYGIPIASARADIMELFDQLVPKGLVQKIEIKFQEAKNDG